MCACPEPVRTRIGAVCVEYGRPKYPITMLNHTDMVQKNVLILIFWHPTHARTTRYEESFLPECKNGLDRFAFSALPHYYIMLLVSERHVQIGL